MSPIEHLPFWPFVILALLSAAVLYSRAINGNIWSLMFRSTYSSRASAQLLREENIMENSFSGLLVFIFFMSLALLLFNVQEFIEINIFVSRPIVAYLFLLFVLAAIYVAKVGLLFLLQFVFEERELFNEYLIVFMNINIAVGIALIPINLIYTYGIIVSQNAILIISGIMLVASIFLRFVRIFNLGLKSKMKWYNIILYLCTLEILPFILIMTALKNLGFNLDLVL